MSHKHLVLGLLAETPMTGYDIRKRIQEKLRDVTNASYGTLYPTLHKLLDKGLLNMEEVPRKGRPAKKIYHITDKGKGELTRWLRKPAGADRIKREFLVKLYLTRHLPENELLTLLANRRDETEANIKALKRTSDDVEDRHQSWIIDYVMSLHHAEMDWLKRIEAQISVI
ncbi:MAG: PadR family transcriptional regulator [Aggregatilineales bacterium]